MKLRWDRKAIADIERQKRWISQNDPKAADDVAEAIENTGESLKFFPRSGVEIEGGARMKVDPKYRYRLVYEIDDSAGIVRVLRVFHPRQARA